MRDSLVTKAEEFATLAHQGQTEEDALKTPYIFHCKSVAELVNQSGGTSEEIAAAWLHDTVEDTPVTIEDIEEEFGAEVATMVKGLTDLPSFSDLPVAERKQRQADHILHESQSVRRIKLADQISAIELDGKNDLLEKDHRIQYVEGAKKIADNCHGISPYLDQKFSETYESIISYLKALQ